MAATFYGVNSPEAVKLYRRKLAREALAATYIGKFIGQSDDSLIQVYDETSKDAGDSVRVTLRGLLNGEGTLGDATLEGNEEALTTFTDNLGIDQLRHAVRSAGKMSEQRIPFKHRDEAKAGLRDWWSDRFDTSFFNQIGGYTPANNVKFTGLQPVLPPTTVIRPNGRANDESLTTADVFTLAQIDDAVAVAKTLAPIMRPIKIDGDDHYVMFLHPFQVRTLRNDTSAWAQLQRAALTGDGSKRNPLFTGALGVYAGVILHEANRVTPGVHSTTGAPVPNVRRALFCGAQAGALGFGKGYSFGENGGGADWNEELFDYGNQLGVEAGYIFGLKKTRFNGRDFSTIVVPTYAASPATGS